MDESWMNFETSSVGSKNEVDVMGFHPKLAMLKRALTLPRLGIFNRKDWISSPKKIDSAPQIWDVWNRKWWSELFRHAKKRPTQHHAGNPYGFVESLRMYLVSIDTWQPPHFTKKTTCILRMFLLVNFHSSSVKSHLEYLQWCDSLLVVTKKAMF